tara:strand:- start:5983 stop:6861 length:879 start_codon:yes stop_codon:yes gene_type:complete
MTLISVLMPVYNGEKHLKEAIDSILNQTFRDFEFIIVNDGSTDNTKSIIDSYDDKRIICVEQENKGLAKSLNIGASHCKGEYIARMDADDISISSRLMDQYLFLKSHPNISVLSSAFSYINENGKYLGRTFPITYPFLIKKKLLNSGCIVCHPSVMIRRKDFFDVGAYTEIMGNRFVDYHLWVKFLKKGYSIKNSSEVLLKYRILDSAITSQYSLSQAGKVFLLKVIKQENPTIEDVKKLYDACIVNTNSFAKRESNYNNIQNYFYNKLRFVNERVKDYIFSLLRNIIAFIH